MKIVIDTNALENDRYAKRPVADAAWRGAAAGDFERVVPEAVIGEHVKHFPEALHDTVGELDAALKKRRREFDTFGLDAPDMPSVDVAPLSAAYEAALRVRCSELRCRVQPTPDLGPALAWAITRRKPFDANGHGLPDAVIWLTVLELTVADDVIFVTNNNKDFGSPSQLRPELRGDLAERGIPEDRVRIVEDLFALQPEIVEPAAEANDPRHPAARGPHLPDRSSPSGSSTRFAKRPSTLAPPTSTLTSRRLQHSAISTLTGSPSSMLTNSGSTQCSPDCTPAGM